MEAANGRHELSSMKARPGELDWGNDPGELEGKLQPVELTTTEARHELS